MPNFAAMKSRLILMMALLALFTACKDKDDPDTPSVASGRTVLVYMMGENSLSKFVDMNIDQMITGSSDIPSTGHLIVYVDDANETTPPRIYEIKGGKKTLVKQYAQEQNSATSATLSAIMSYTITNFPAKSYGLVLWSHASAWAPSKSSTASSAPSTDGRRRTIGIDNGTNSSGSNTGTEMEVADLANALSAFPKTDFIFCDACFMQSVEVAYELRNVTHYLVGSPAEIPGYGAPYDLIMTDMFAQPADVNGLIKHYYNKYASNYGILLSVIDCTKMDSLATATARVLPTFIKNKSEISIDTLQQYSVFNAYSYYRPEYFDMNSIMHANLSATDYAQWVAVFNKAVPYRAETKTWLSAFSYYFQPTLRNESLYGGMSMFVPSARYAGHNLNEAFQKTAWYTGAQWAQTGW
jgi:hypothetical protein